jgi:hypothetical protein
MESTKIGVIVKQQAWFRPLVNVEKLSPFPAASVDSTPLQPTGVYQARVLVGRGPFDRELTPEFLFWFEHGEVDYPTFQCPSIGPSGAGLRMTSRPRRILASEDEALGLIEISLIQPVPQSFRDEYEGGRESDPPDGPAGVVRGWLAESQMWLEQAVGLYALYQYPLVWEPLGVHTVAGFVDLAANAFQMSTRFEADNFIPFRLNVETKLANGRLEDDGLANLSRLQNRGLHFPLFLLQRALWQRNVQLRFSRDIPVARLPDGPVRSRGFRTRGARDPLRNNRNLCPAGPSGTRGSSEGLETCRAPGTFAGKAWNVPEASGHCAR